MKYIVKRQDDHGNIFNASMWYDDLVDAVAAKDRREENVHKQMFWIEDQKGRCVDVHLHT